VRTTRARRVDVKLGGKLVYELDGGARDEVKRFSAEVVPGAIKICVPRVPEPGQRTEQPAEMAVAS